MAIPFHVDGFYPLYSDELSSNSHIGGNGTSHTHQFYGVTYYMPNGLDSGDQFHGTYVPGDPLFRKKLKVTWKRPLHINDTVSLVLYRYKQDVIEPTCENMTTIGQLVYETHVIDEGFYDDEVPSGTWHYAIYAKNKAGLSPCAIDTYEIAFDSDGDGVPDDLDNYPYDPNRASGVDSDGDGIDDEFDTISANIIINSIVTNDLQATFDISVIGTDIQAWAFSVDGGAPVQGTTTTFTVELASDGVHNILFEGFDGAGNFLIDEEASFNLLQDAYINIERLEVNPAGHIEVDVDVGGTDVEAWGTQVYNESDALVSFTDPKYLLSSGVTTDTRTNVNGGARYKVVVVAVDSSDNNLAVNQQFINLPRQGADSLWGTDTGSGQLGIPEPDLNFYTGAQGGYAILEYPDRNSPNFDVIHQSSVYTGFLTSSFFTDQADVWLYQLKSSVYREMIPEKWYQMTTVSIDNVNGDRCIRLFVNGILTGQMVLHNQQYSSQNRNLLIGAVDVSSWHLDYAFNGKIDQPCFWERTLSTNEIQELYNDGNGLSYGNMSASMKSGMMKCYEFDSAAVVSTSSHSGVASTEYFNAFNYSVEKVNNQDANIKVAGAQFINHQITQPGGKVSAHAFTPCFLPGLRDGINPSTGAEYTTAELAEFYGRDTRKVAAILVDKANDTVKHIPADFRTFTSSVWLKREGRGPGKSSNIANLRGANTAYLIAEYAGWSNAKISKFTMTTSGPSYESDPDYWMLGK